MSNNIYNILGKLKGITDSAVPTTDTATTTVYESVDARGSITEAVKSLEAKYQTFKEAAGKPDFLDLDKDGDKKEPMKKAAKDKNNAKGAFKDMFGGSSKDLTSKLKIKEAEEVTDLDAYQFAEPDTDTAVAPSTAKQSAAEKRRRLQDIEDRRAEKDDWFSGKDAEPNVRIHKATYQDEPEEVDEVTTATGGEVTKVGNVTTHKGKKYGGEEEFPNHTGHAKDIMDRKHPYRIVDLGDPEDYDLDESIKFGDKIDNSKAEMKKAKLAKIKESRVMEETDYFYEKVGKALAEKDPTLDTSTGDFKTAVRKEMVAQGLDVNRARNILAMDQDFLSDVATSYAHCCKELAECGAPMNSHLGGVSELDEIAQLAGLSAPTREQAMGLERSPVAELDEAQGVDVNGKEINVGSIEVEGVYSWDSPDFADAYITYAEFMDGTPLSDDEIVQLEQTHGDLVNQAAHDSLQGAGDFLDEVDMEEGNAFTGKLADTPPGETFKLGDKTFTDTSKLEEEDMAEGNEFSGALAAARASGSKEFEVDGKRYTVKEDINVNITANGEEDALNLFRKLAGMEEVTAQPAIQAVGVTELPQDAESAIAQGMIDAVDEERDPEYVNSPREQTAGIDAAIPSGNDLHATKRAYKIAQPGDNPMAVAEAKDTSWSKYTSMLKSLLK